MAENRVRDLPSRYDPSKVEEKIYQRWEKAGYFNADRDPNRKPYTIVIPPPNVTGILHMGHALNNTYQDILIRYHRMRGYNALWMPGTDHAGIATQNVVERKLAKQGLRRQDLGREKFVQEVWKWKEEYGSTIIRQLKRLGASCDWRRLRFTMDSDYSIAVRYVFVHLYKKGLIYQGNYIINWCPRCHTALADEEAPKKETRGKLYYVRYPIKGEKKEFIVVATTRPETILGDTAVAVNPNDERYKDLIGKKVILPIVNREIPIIADDYVDPEFGTGAVKITPAHDPDDFWVGKRHNLDAPVVIDSEGKMTELAGPYKGLDRFECRKQIVSDLQELRLIEKIEDYVHNVGHCYRCDTVIEPYLSRQWFVKMKPLAEPAIKAVKGGKIRFIPSRWTKVYLNWMENIQDWCISRQIWWGHRIPVWYCVDKDGNRTNCPPIVEMEDPKVCPNCGNTNLLQDEDVLDTWFSSWLWPFATFYWPKDDPDVKADLEYFYPTNTLVTAPEILFFWVARMIMAGLEFMGEIPFSDVYLHGTVRDDTGRKMSKSLGNIIDPLEIIEEMGADALRFSLISITAVGQDVYLSRSKFELGRNFTNKIWNATRYIFSNLLPEVKDVDWEERYLTLEDKWILDSLSQTVEKVNVALQNYRFNESANLVYDFFWHQFCDWYIEATKIDRGKEIKVNQQKILLYVLEHFLRLLHPFMPFITEEIYQRLKEVMNLSGQTIMLMPYPQEGGRKDPDARQRFELVKSLVYHLRNMRTQVSLRPTDRPDVLLSGPKAREVLESVELVRFLARVGKVEEIEEGQRPSESLAGVLPGLEFFLMLSGLVDVEKEKERVKHQIEETRKAIEKKESLLNNPNFLTRAPKNVVEGEKKKLEELNDTLKRLEALYDGLKGS